MTNQIVTSSIADIPHIFDPKAQELEEVGNARILYVFDEDGEPIRERVGEEFELSAKQENITFMVSLPVVGPVQDGTIKVLENEELLDEYSLDKDGLQKLMFDLNTTFGLDDIDTILNLLDEQV
ncbi:MAG: hypothetical protein NC218_01400 [Acetobacter sp.]|nr:hypothetical protein [Acetobacter sp.]